MKLSLIFRPVSLSELNAVKTQTGTSVPSFPAVFTLALLLCQSSHPIAVLSLQDCQPTDNGMDI